MIDFYEKTPSFTLELVTNLPLLTLGIVSSRKYLWLDQSQKSYKCFLCPPECF